MDAENYAKALISAAKTEKDTDALIASFFKVLKARGALKLLPKILTFLEHAQTKNASAKPTLTIAREKDKDSALMQIENAIKGIVSSKDEIEIKIDDSIIGGYRFQTSKDLLDESYKTKLLSIYRSVRAS